MGWLVLGVISALIALAGMLGANIGLILAGLAGMALAGAGYALYRRMVSRWALLRVYPDRLEFARGPQKGVLQFADVTAIRQLHWGHSWFPYQRAATVLVLQSAKVEYQVGRDIADHEAVQEAVVRALNEFHAGNHG